MIEAAEGDGRLAAGGSVVEYTGGSTGVSLSLVCAVKRYALHIVTSDAFSKEKLDHMSILGAKLHIIRTESGGMTGKLTRDMVEAARVIAAETGSFWTDQLNNTDQLAAYHRMGEEIWTQAHGRNRRLCPGRRHRGVRSRRRGSPAPSQASRSASWPLNRPNPPYCPAARQALTGSMGSERASWCRSGEKGSPIGSNASPRTRRSPWRFDWPGRKVYSRGLPPACNVDRRVATGRAAATGREHRHGDVRYRDEVSQDLRSRAEQRRRSPRFQRKVTRLQWASDCACCLPSAITGQQ